MAKRKLIREEWRSTIAEWRASGLSREEYCEPRGLNARTMAWWEGTLARGGRGGGGSRARATKFVEVTSAVAGIDTRLELELGGVHVRVPASFDDGALRRVLAVLEARR